MPAALPTGWPAVDAVLADAGHGAARLPGGLARGNVHEWFGLIDPQSDAPTPGVTPAPGTAPAPGAAPPEAPRPRRTPRGQWTPPLCVLTHLAIQAWRQALAFDPTGGRAWVVWIGRRIWPHPLLLARGPRWNDPHLPDPSPRRRSSRRSKPRGGSVSAALAAAADAGPAAPMDALVSASPSSSSPPPLPSPFADFDAPDLDPPMLASCLWVAPADDAGRLWAIDLALRCPAVTLVVADASGFDMAASRRLQLAARAGSALALLARPLDDLVELSAATTRWLVRREPSPSCVPRWSVELTRRKGPGLGSGRVLLTTEWNRVSSHVLVPAPVADRPAAAADRHGRSVG